MFITSAGDAVDGTTVDSTLKILLWDASIIYENYETKLKFFKFVHCGIIMSNWRKAGENNWKFETNDGSVVVILIDDLRSCRRFSINYYL